jgi:hypothetical protein
MTPAEHEGENEDRECHRREAFEEKREHDRESITGLHEAEERPVLADDERRERAGCDGDAGQRAHDENRVGETRTQQANGRQQHEAGDARTDDVEHEERADRRHGGEVRVVVLLRVNRCDEQQSDRADAA